MQFTSQQWLQQLVASARVCLHRRTLQPAPRAKVNAAAMPAVPPEAAADREWLQTMTAAAYAAARRVMPSVDATACLQAAATARVISQLDAEEEVEAAPCCCITLAQGAGVVSLRFTDEACASSVHRVLADPWRAWVEAAQLVLNLQAFLDQLVSDWLGKHWPAAQALSIELLRALVLDAELNALARETVENASRVFVDQIALL